MLQDIHPHHIDMTFKITPPEDGDFVVAVRGNKVLLAEGTEHGVIPEYGALRGKLSAANAELVYLFSVGGRAVHCVVGDAGDVPGCSYADIMTFRTYQPRWQAFAGATASHLGGWYAANRFCGGCGTRMTHKPDERAMRCDACGAVVYPRISPAVIVGVVDGDRILMTKYANRPGAKLTALIAGFMEIGETLEDTVRREVFEEVGVRVKNIRYYKSQPWAFSGSVLVGFFTDLDGASDITMDTAELQEARWISRAELEPNDDAFSLTSEMVETFRADRMPGQAQNKMD